jgi:hypothetical protein
MHTAELLVPGPGCIGVEIVVVKWKKYESSGSNPIPAELLQAGGETLVSAIHKSIYSIWNMEELPSQCKESIIIPFHIRG